ncbi:hypothetical protein SGPA1_21767 [Streptomyces misionensis JCM 4497]
MPVDTFAAAIRRPAAQDTALGFAPMRKPRSNPGVGHPLLRLPDQAWIRARESAGRRARRRGGRIDTRAVTRMGRRTECPFCCVRGRRSTRSRSRSGTW